MLLNVRSDLQDPSILVLLKHSFDRVLALFQLVEFIGVRFQLRLHFGELGH